VRIPLLVVCLLACAPETPPNLPRGASLEVTEDASGWLHVREPGWFTVDLPSAPHSALVPDLTPEGVRFVYKKIGVSGATGLYTIGYVELGATEAAHDARAIVKRYDEHAPAGLELEPSHRATLGGGDARAIDGTAAPNSETNSASFSVEVHGRVAAHGGRLFQLQCSVPHASAADCDRFFGSFRFE
jgi:hypothetical protein